MIESETLNQDVANTCFTLGQPAVKTTGNENQPAIESHRKLMGVVMHDFVANTMVTTRMRI